MAGTLDLLSKGRLILSVGAGWYQPEFDAFGLPWESHKERIEREREAIQIIRALWTQPSVTFEGKYYQLKEASVDPKPVQKPTPPIWVGGDSRQTMELAAELADGWMMHGHSPEEVGRVVGKMKPMLVDRTDDFTIGTAHFFALANSQTEAMAKIQGRFPQEIWGSFMNAPHPQGDSKPSLRFIEGMRGTHQGIRPGRIKISDSGFRRSG